MATAVTDIFALHAQANPGKACVIEGDDVFSFADINAEVNRLVGGLKDLGFGPGDRVVWCGPNAREVLVTIHAARKLRLVAIPLSSSRRPYHFTTSGCSWKSVERTLTRCSPVMTLPGHSFGCLASSSRMSPIVLTANLWNVFDCSKSPASGSRNAARISPVRYVWSTNAARLWSARRTASQPRMWSTELCGEFPSTPAMQSQITW